MGDGLIKGDVTTRVARLSLKSEVSLSASASTPIVAIATPVYNGVHHIAETMQCAQSQAWPHIVHCIRGNASSDETPEIIASFVTRRIPVLERRNLRDAVEFEQYLNGRFYEQASADLPYGRILFLVTSNCDKPHAAASRA